MNKLIDVSSYNGTISWGKAKAQGVDGAILKIIRKNLLKDTQFVTNVKGCEAAGMPWGVYNYSYATTASKAESDMKIVCDILDGMSKKYFTLGVWFDIEDDVQAKLSKAKIAEILNAAKKVVEGRGYKFGIYTGLAYYKAHMAAEKIKCKNWWIARYYKGYTSMSFSTNPAEKYKPLSSCFAWQYTSCGTFSPAISSGNGGKVDLSVLYKSFDSTASTTTTTTTAKKTYTGTFPALPPRGYYKIGDGYKTLTDYGTQIKRVQQFVNWAVSSGLTVDGDYGEKTAAGVKKFQKAVGITVDGEFGKNTLAKAKSYTK